MIYKEIYYIQQQEMVFLIFEFLLKNGININEPQKDGSTSLHGAAFYNQEIIVQLFLEYGAKQI